jgi:glucose/arabinose dehydrogenase
MEEEIMKNSIRAGVGLFVFIAIIGFGLPGFAESPTITRVNFMSGLQSPWDMAFTPNGTMFYTEKCLGLSVRMPNGTIRRLFGVAGYATLAKDLVCEGQSGMMGVALDPDFATNRRVYVDMSSNKSNPRTNRVIRLTLNAGLSAVTKRVDIIKDIPFKNVGNDWGDPGAHSGGRLRFSPSGALYVTSGDNHNGTLPQDLTHLGGKIIRVDRNGLAYPGNNAPDGADPRIFAYGFRNVQGIAFRPGSNQVFVSEHGPNHSDEVTRIRAGGNGGWDPQPDPGVVCASNYCGYISNRADGKLTSMTDFEKFPTALKPVKVYADSQGMGPCAFLNGAQWKDWNGGLMIGIMGAGKVEVLHLKANGSLQATSQVTLPKQRVRSIVQGPGGALYMALDSGVIWKITAK